MKYVQKSFSVQPGLSDAYRSNYDRIFRSTCKSCGAPVASGEGLANAYAVVCSWECAGKYNTKHGINHAFGPNR